MLVNIQKKSVILVIILLCLITSSMAYSEGFIKDKNKVYMVIVNRLSLNDIESMHNLKNIVKDGSIGLMNTRGVSGYKGSEGYITINASSKATSSYETANSFNMDEKILSVYERRVGKIEGDYKIVNVEINRLKELNRNNPYNPVIGALGNNLHNSGYKTAVFGNSDTADSFVRTNCLIAIDSNGLIDYGNVDDILIDDDEYPFSIRTDFNKIQNEVKDIKSEASLIVIETGDLDRLSLYSNELSEDMYLELRGKVLRNIDEFIGDLLADIKNSNSMLMVVSPNSPDERIDSSKLSPIVIWDNETYDGILTSGTTRRNGIIANFDIAPTITNYLDAEKDNFIGHVINSNENNDKLSFVNELNNRTNIVSKLRPSYLNLFSVFTILVLILGIAAIFTKSIYFNKISRILRILILLILTIPLVFLIIAFLNIKSRFAFFVIAFLLLVGILGIICLIKEKYRIVTLVALTFTILSIDILLGGNLLKYSVLGYDPIIGARYFGVGNEYVGVLLATMVFLVTFLLEKTKGSKIFLLILPFTVFLVSHPNLGANLGGTISILFAAIVLLLQLYKVKLKLKKIFIIGILVLLFIIGMGLIDLYINASPTHLGKTLAMIIEKGPVSILNIIIRKLQMNIKLIKSSIWSKVLLTTILSEVYMLLGCKKQIIKIFHENKYISIGIISTLVGSIVGFLLNDSGVLLAAISNIYTTTVLMYLTLNHIIES